MEGLSSAQSDRLPFRFLVLRVSCPDHSDVLRLGGSRTVHSTARRAKRKTGLSSFIRATEMNLAPTDIDVSKPFLIRKAEADEESLVLACIDLVRALDSLA